LGYDERIDGHFAAKNTRLFPCAFSFAMLPPNMTHVVLPMSEIAAAGATRPL
jgi:hypothetical protein